MFLHLSVSHSVHGGEYLGRYTPGQVHPPGRYTPGQVYPLGRYTPQAGTPPGRYTSWAGAPPWRVHPQEGTPPGQVHPLRAVHAGRYGQQAGGTHPTGMHSCYFIQLLVSIYSLLGLHILSISCVILLVCFTFADIPQTVTIWNATSFWQLNRCLSNQGFQTKKV